MPRAVDQRTGAAGDHVAALGADPDGRLQGVAVSGNDAGRFVPAYDVPRLDANHAIEEQILEDDRDAVQPRDLIT